MSSAEDREKSKRRRDSKRRDSQKRDRQWMSNPKKKSAGRHGQYTSDYFGFDDYEFG